jgi:hypothetical protein
VDPNDRHFWSRTGNHGLKEAFYEIELAIFSLLGTSTKA